MIYTENYNFAMPEDTDVYDISPLNENFETLDTILSENETAQEEINEKIGTPAQSGQTLFSLLNNNNSSPSIIKSIQRVTLSSPNTRVNINTVNPAKCFVITERLANTISEFPKYDYVLHADHIEMTTITSIENRVEIGRAHV